MIANNSSKAFAAYCRTTLVNCMINYKKSRQKINHHELAFMSENQFTSVHEETFIKHHIKYGEEVIEFRDTNIFNALLKLSEENLKIILLYYGCELSENAIAMKLQMPQSTVNYRKRQSLKTLRNEIESVEGVDCQL